jgi:8-oxo-dGTP pyrophosphatase MutT (NUDIX family)
MSGGIPRAFDVSNRSTIQQYNAGEFEFPDSSRWWRVLWRQLRITPPLSGRLLQLRERLARASTASYDDPDLLWAAVALIVAPSPDSLLLIQRAERPGDPWSGHMALPGGRRDPEDVDLLATALRETSEEVGISLSRESLVGALADVVPRTPTLPPIAVRPFLLAVPNRPVLILNPEVAAASWVGLEELLRPDAHQQVSVNIQGISREVSAFLLEAGLVWGMTERVLSGLVEHFRGVRSEES